MEAHGSASVVDAERSVDDRRLVEHRLALGAPQLVRTFRLHSMGVTDGAEMTLGHVDVLRSGYVAGR